MSIERKQIGSYRVIRVLGVGGMGTVYEAQHQQIARHVAIKVLHGEFSQNRELVERFLNEARAVNEINHAGVIKIFDADKLEDGTPFLVMELLAGHSLAEYLLHKRTMPMKVMLDVAQQLAESPRAAHSRLIVHRDLKPDKITPVEKWLSDFLVPREKCGEVISDASRDTVLPSFSCEQAHTCHSTRWLVRTSASFGRSSRLRHGDAPSSASSHHSVFESGFRRIRMLRRCGLVSRVSGYPTSVP